MSELVRGLPGNLLLSDVALASVFTTQSVTPLLEQVRARIKTSTPAAADFVLGAGGVRTVFPLASITRSSSRGRARPRRRSRSPRRDAVPFLYPAASAPSRSAPSTRPTTRPPSKVIPPSGRLAGPAVQGTNRLYFNLFLPAGTAPRAAGRSRSSGTASRDNKNASPFIVASSLARRGIATIAINVVGHGGGALGTLIVNRTAGTPVVLSAGGRGIDQDGNTTIDSTEGVNAVAPYTLVSNRDGLRQTVIDLMQLVREIEVGMDVDGDGARDLDPGRISYVGQSFGGIYGVKFLAVEPNVRLGVPNVPGGAIIEIARLSPAFRGLVTLSLINRTPPLINLPGFAFNENMPLRNLPPVIDTVPGASGDPASCSNGPEWATQSGNPARTRRIRALEAAGGRAGEVGDPPVRPHRPDRAEPDDIGDHPRRRAPGPDDGLPERSRLRGRSDVPEEPAHVPDDVSGLAPPGAAAVALAAQEQIALFLRLQRRDRDRSRRSRPALRDAVGRAAGRTWRTSRTP
jgi:hypothetical protein